MSRWGLTESRCQWSGRNTLRHPGGGHSARRDRSKLQIPSTKLQRNTKHQNGIALQRRDLEFGIWSFFGAWCFSQSLGANAARDDTPSSLLTLGGRLRGCWLEQRRIGRGGNLGPFPEHALTLFGSLGFYLFEVLVVGAIHPPGFGEPRAARRGQCQEKHSAKDFHRGSATRL